MNPQMRCDPHPSDTPLRDKESRANGNSPPPVPLLCGADICLFEITPCDRSQGMPLARIRDLPERAGAGSYKVRSVAANYGLSTRTLQRDVKAAIGATPRWCLMCLRLRRARRLLDEGKNVSETADILCYRDHSHFSREFKKWIGTAPKHYTMRKQ
jgi:AraC-like DNA-binding protein